MQIFPLIEKPIQRKRLRKILGKNYFILKRRIQWLVKPNTYSKVRTDSTCAIKVIQHRSQLLRPLKDLDMQLQHNKITNLRIAIAALNDVVILPGETFSIWKLVGKPTKNKGYLTGLTLENGRISTGIGGGLCQLGNLIYWMALHSPLSIHERWRHSYDVFPDVNRTIPFACGATLSYNYVDLQLKNETKESFKIELWLDKTHLNGLLLTSGQASHVTEVYETDHRIIHQPWGGYTRHNKIWRKKTNIKDGTIEEELVTENAAIMMYNPLIH